MGQIQRTNHSETIMWNHIYTSEYNMVSDTSIGGSESILSIFHPLVALLKLMCILVQQKGPNISNLHPFCIYNLKMGSLSANTALTFFALNKDIINRQE